MAKKQSDPAVKEELAKLNEIPGVGGVPAPEETEFPEELPQPRKIIKFDPAIDKRMDSERWMLWAAAAASQTRILPKAAAKFADAMEEEYQSRFGK